MLSECDCTEKTRFYFVHPSCIQRSRSSQVSDTKTRIYNNKRSEERKFSTLPERKTIFFCISFIALLARQFIPIAIVVGTTAATENRLGIRNNCIFNLLTQKHSAQSLICFTSFFWPVRLYLAMVRQLDATLCWSAIFFVHDDHICFCVVLLDLHHIIQIYNIAWPTCSSVFVFFCVCRWPNIKHTKHCEDCTALYSIYSCPFFAYSFWFVLFLSSTNSSVLMHKS